jgi:hypothetical protein
MSNALTAFMSDANLPALSDEALADAIEEAQGGAAYDGVTYVDFSGKIGDYRCGRDKESIDPGRLFLLEPMAVLKGWICWKGGRPVGRVEWQYLNTNAAVKLDELEDHGPYDVNSDGWSESRGFGAIALDDRSQFKFSTNSASGRNSVEDLMTSIKDRAKAKEASMPIIKFGKETFVARGNRNWKPVFPAQAWVSRAAAEAFLQGKMSQNDLLNGIQPS